MSKQIRPLTPEEKEEFENWLPTKEQAERYWKETGIPTYELIKENFAKVNNQSRIRGMRANDIICDDYSTIGPIMLKLKVKRLSPNAKLPTKANDTDAGWDLYANIEKPIFIPVNGLAVIETGIACAIPVGYCGQLFDRSSYGVNGTTRLAGVIDATYRGEIKVILYSFRGRIIKPGDKFIQMLIAPVPAVEIEEVENLDETERGEGGFGSSGN